MQPTTLTRRRMMFLGATSGLGLATLGRWPAHAAAPWPTHRGDEQSERFIGEMLHVGDPLADAVVAELVLLGSGGKKLLQSGIAQGLKSLADPPPALAAFLRANETIPPWVTPSTYTGGSRTFMSIPLPAHALTLALGALTHTYSSPAIAAVLIGTGELIKSTQRRLLETTDWLLRCMQPGALRVGGSGYVATLQVRMLHAQARARTLANGWDVAAFGTPISQVDLVRTWLDFLPVSYGCLSRLGYDLTSAEISDLYRTWWYIAHLLGIDPRLYRRITDHTTARQLLTVVDATNQPPDANSRALVTESVRATSGLFSLATVLPPISTETINATFRHINGDPIADLYAIRRTPAQALIPPTALATRNARTLARAIPLTWNTQIKFHESLTETFLNLLPTSAYASGGYAHK
ncbi:hypothetical protein Aple_068230 [Acrocarpospora pleiomorpha]|uniref:ER-bound oxygenase mpaB/mpaB'/Rubber oxygenase catalytic domain-containing protein n=1 Tax=Acrocarpospora pleiomorpha TaxID=90975 RepID=A0A5M3XRR2_9ACTN|nr:oxygenase MpaB family protein [Acrocarpospora pleiomorpha]GES23924.1 hypothetical protein Aple_068230 [Acrocarpospora pleiomorpha]